MVLSFSYSTFGKCILAGEHSVLRGVPAVVFPVFSKSLTLKYEPTNDNLQAWFSGETGSAFQLLFSGVVDQALKQLNLSRDKLKGQCFIDGNLPIGTGLGASAALCVNVGMLFNHLGYVLKKDMYEFCRQLEDLFHGESSGVDIAAAVEGQGIVFSRGGDWRKVKTTWQPHLYISYSGQVGATSECVKQVKALFDEDLEKALQLDEQMAKAVEHVVGALESESEDRLEKLVQGIQLAENCFDQWQLTRGSVGRHIQELKEEGALAAKPTGSGNGGFILSLWKDPPSKQAVDKFHLIDIHAGASGSSS